MLISGQQSLARVHGQPNIDVCTWLAAAMFLLNFSSIYSCHLLKASFYDTINLAVTAILHPHYQNIY